MEVWSYLMLEQRGAISVFTANMKNGTLVHISRAVSCNTAYYTSLHTQSWDQRSVASQSGFRPREEEMTAHHRAELAHTHRTNHRSFDCSYSALLFFLQTYPAPFCLIRSLSGYNTPTK